jgi:hypothetical protein
MGHFPFVAEARTQRKPERLIQQYLNFRPYVEAGVSTHFVAGVDRGRVETLIEAVSVSDAGAADAEIPIARIEWVNSGCFRPSSNAAEDLSIRVSERHPVESPARAGGESKSGADVADGPVSAGLQDAGGFSC